MSKSDVGQVFLTVEALFWYHLDFYQALVSIFQTKEKHVATELHHFIEVSSLDQAVFFTSFPSNLQYFKQLRSLEPKIELQYQLHTGRFAGSLRGAPCQYENTLADQMGHFYRRFGDLKNQICAMIEFGPEGPERERLQECKFLIVAFEDACGKLCDARFDQYSLLNAVSKTDTSLVKDRSPFAPLYTMMDRRETIQRTIQQMQLNAKVRYNQTIFWVDCKESKPGKPNRVAVSSTQVSLSLFSRHLALLEIVFPKKGLFRSQKTDVWSYRLLQPLIPLDQVTMHSVPESAKSQFFVEVRITDAAGSKQMSYYKCEDAKQKRDLIQQFRLIQLEACPNSPASYPWQYQSAARVTSSVEAMLDAEKMHGHAQFCTAGLPGKSESAQCRLSRLTQC